jgi:hypothetical protein
MGLESATFAVPNDEGKGEKEKRRKGEKEKRRKGFLI